jgi:hypothetical protein
MRAESGQEISNKYNQLFIPRTHSVYYTCSAALFSQITVAALCNKAALVFVVSGSFEASAGDKKLASPCSCVGKGCLCGCCQHQFRPWLHLLCASLSLVHLPGCEIDLSAPIRGSVRRYTFLDHLQHCHQSKWCDAAQRAVYGLSCLTQRLFRLAPNWSGNIRASLM